MSVYACTLHAGLPTHLRWEQVTVGSRQGTQGHRTIQSLGNTPTPIYAPDPGDRSDHAASGAHVPLRYRGRACTRAGLRHRAVLPLGFAGASRRAELGAHDVADLEFSSARLAVTSKKSKIDQEGRSRRIGIPYGSSQTSCPMRALQVWLKTARIVDGGVFRSLVKFQRVQPRQLSDKAVARIRLTAAGDASEGEHEQERPPLDKMVRCYLREANLFAADKAASLVGP
jgi:hypothetical protein